MAAREMTEHDRAQDEEDRVEARRWLANLTDDPWPGDGSVTYTEQTDRTESYMVGGNGPTVYIRFVLRDDEEEGTEDIVRAFVDYSHSGPAVQVTIGEWDAETLLERCRRDAAARNAR